MELVNRIDATSWYRFRLNQQDVKDCIGDAIGTPIDSENAMEYFRVSNSSPTKIDKIVDNFLDGAVKYGYYRHILEESHLPISLPPSRSCPFGVLSVPFVEAKIHWPGELQEPRLSVNMAFLTTVNINDSLPENPVVCKLVCQENPLPDEILSQLPGIAVVRFPRGLYLASGVPRQLLGTSDYITYSLARLRVDIKDNDLPKYLTSNPIMAEYASERLGRK